MRVTMSVLFSSGYEPADPRNYGLAIERAFLELEQFVPGGVRAVCIPRASGPPLIAAVLSIQVALPSRGPVNNVDIRTEEPLLLVFDSLTYPYRAPWVLSDRRDFPSGQLPHLNPVPKGYPAWLCLYRGDIDDWFAERSLADLLFRARQWLRDAAMNRLIPPEDGFEPTRMPEAPGGHCIFDADLLTNTVYQRWKQTRGSAGFIPLLMRLHVGDLAASTFSGTTVSVVETIESPDSVRTSLGSRRDLLIGLLAWPAKDNVCPQYFGYLPRTYNELLRLAEMVGLQIEEPLESCQTIGLTGGRFVPAILAIQRPKCLIGSTSRLELLSFLLVRKIAIGDDGFTLDGFDSRVFVLANRTPLTPKRAAALSDMPEYRMKGQIAVIGCGAVGSKVALHVARAGWEKFLLVDHDAVSAHNMVRHGLLGVSAGKNKAKALAEALCSLYVGTDGQVDAKVYPDRCFGLLQGKDRARLDAVSVLLDATASRAVLRALVDADLGDSILVARCELADSGQLGLFFVEGADRNPRLDDLRTLLFDHALDDEALSNWLRSRPSAASDFEHEEIQIGVGCSSDTMRLGDTAISYHASLFGRAMQDLLTRSGARLDGWVLITSLPDDLTDSVSTKILSFKPMKLLTAKNASEWQVRLSRVAMNAIRRAVRSAGSNETGGILIGRTYQKSRVICVTRTLPPPSDSLETPYAFRRGVKDVPESIQDLYARSGGQLGYVGEWHSHPNGSVTLSKQDKRAARQIQRHLSCAQLPTHLLIATEKVLAPYVFDASADIE